MSRALPVLLLLFSLAGKTAEGERPVPPESASMAPVGGWCDALTGGKKEQCLREERRRQEKEQESARRERCDGLIGPDSERCLRRGGRLEVNAEPGGASSGATAQ